METLASALEKLVSVITTLRGPDGCPWDKKQTHQSLIPSFIEEFYEFIDAVEAADYEEMKEELGDLCLHIVFQAQIAQDNREFTLQDALTHICEKLIRRHPHVFGDVKVKDTDEVFKNWDAIKKKEKGAARASVLDGIPRHLPPLHKARTVQEKARRVGFDWEHIDQVLAKVDEELVEVREALKNNDKDAVEDELGDLLFAVVNVARFAEVEPSRALHRTIEKFTRRFRAIEEELAKKNMTPSEASFEELDALWDATKADAKQ